VQFGPEGGVVLVAHGMDEPHGMRCPGDVHAVVRPERELVSPIAGHPRLAFASPLDPQADARSAVDHYWPVAQVVRTDRHDGKHSQSRLEDGPAAGEGVGRRAGRGRDDEAVAALFVDEGAVDAELNRDEARGVPLFHHHVVERPALCHGDVTTADAPGQTDASILHETPGEDPGKLLLELARGEVGEEAQATEIDAQHGRIARGDALRGAQQSPVAAEGNEEFARAPVERERWGAVRRVEQQFTGDGIGADGDTVFVQQGNQPTQGICDPRVIPPGEDADTLEHGRFSRVGRRLHPCPVRARDRPDPVDCGTVNRPHVNTSARVSGLRAFALTGCEC